MGELTHVLGAVGFTDVRVTGSFDPFLGSSKEKTARHFGVRGVNVAAVKPAGAGPRSSTRVFPLEP